MPRFIHSAISLTITTLLLALVLRTWLVIGIVDPVTVAGSSMAPTLRGPHGVAACPSCKTNIEVGAEFAARSDNVACPECGWARVPLGGLVVQRGDRLWIDRTLAGRNQPRRWEIVVLRQPDEGDQLCVKRVVALPGETVKISGGDILVNGKVVVKPVDKQLALRRAVSRSSKGPGNWKSASGNAWKFSEGVWRYSAFDNQAFDLLSYEPKNGQPVTDSESYNAGVSRWLNRVRDFMLTAKIQATGKGQLLLQLDEGVERFRIAILPSTGEVTLSRQGQTLFSSTLSAAVVRRMRQQPISLIFSNFDRQLLLLLDGQVELRYLLDEQTPLAGTAHPWVIGARGLEVSLSELAVYRDIYYSPTPLGARLPENKASVQLGPGEYFVLGDNPPISFDSRVWGPVSGRLLVGRPLGVR